jgi:hypothetical protein
MIRIETTAKFDAEGRFTVTGRTTQSVSPGEHSVVVEVDENPPQAVSECMPSSVDEPAFKKVGNLWVFTGETLEDPEEVRRRLDDEYVHRMLNGPFE